MKKGRALNAPRRRKKVPTKKYKAISGITNKDGELIPMNTEFDASEITPEAKKKFLSLKAIEAVQAEETEEEESSALTLENLNKMSPKTLGEMAKARNLEFDPKAKTSELAQLVYDHDLANAG